MLAINRDLFCSGSRIIVTTRNISSVDFLQPDSVYSPPKLNTGECVKLLSLNAFGTIHPKDGYWELSNEVVTYAGGLPLTLEVLGSSVFDKGKDEWRSMIEDLKTSPPGDIHEKLKISFESLDNKNKELFLDIAFFFIGMKKDFTVKVLEDSQLRYPAIKIEELVRRCLLRIDSNNTLGMHDLLRDMGREVVRQQSWKEPGERSRLWYQEDILHVLRDCTGTKVVEGIRLELAPNNEEQVNTVAFANMSNLRFLLLNYLCGLRGSYVTSSTKLKWICWHGFPLSHIPAELCMENLVAIDLQYSKLKEFWKEPKRLDKLRFLNLSYSHHLTKTPDFLGLKSLEELLFNDCVNLVEVHSSIGCLDKLLILNLANCKNLQEVPSSLFTLSALRDLDLSGCPKLGERVQSRGLLSMFWQMLTRRQDSLAISTASVGGLSILKRLNLQDCNLLYIPCEINTLVSLEYLILDGNNFRSLPCDLSNLSHLKYVGLIRCFQLESLPDLPTTIQHLDASHCLMLGTESVQLQMGKGYQMTFTNCPTVDWTNACYYYLRRNIHLTKQKGHGIEGEYLLVFSGGWEIPNGFQFKCSGSSMSFMVRPIISKKIVGVAVCFVVAMGGFGISNRFKLTNRSRGTHKTVKVWTRGDDCALTFTWIVYLPLPQSDLSGFPFSLTAGDVIGLECYNCESGKGVVTRCGACLMYEEDEDEEIEVETRPIERIRSL